MKPAVDEMFPEGAGPYVDLDEVGWWRRGAMRGGGSTPANLRGSPGLWGFRGWGSGSCRGQSQGPRLLT
ncbi:mCG20113, isoform CRA_a [Mus musculus]|nr:mCG20113, isoform CRA_a [Mus musculus]